MLILNLLAIPKKSTLNCDNVQKHFLCHKRSEKLSPISAGKKEGKRHRAGSQRPRPCGKAVTYRRLINRAAILDGMLS